jgi:hypothetical protein
LCAHQNNTLTLLRIYSISELLHRRFATAKQDIDGTGAKILRASIDGLRHPPRRRTISAAVAALSGGCLGWAVRRGMPYASRDCAHFVLRRLGNEVGCPQWGKGQRTAMAGNAGGQGGNATYHRLRSPTQTVADDQMQVTTKRVCGRAAWGSHIPSVKAYPGSLPVGCQGIEFTTAVRPSSGRSTPSMIKWYQGDPGVIVGGPGLACIPVTVVRVVP